MANKSDVIEAMAEKAGIPKTKAGDALEGLMEFVMHSLKKNDTVQLIGFGTFYASDRAATTGRNPKTGAPIKIKARKQPKFKAGVKLKEAVN